MEVSGKFESARPGSIQRVKKLFAKNNFDFSGKQETDKGRPPKPNNETRYNKEKKNSVKVSYARETGRELINGTFRLKPRCEDYVLAGTNPTGNTVAVVCDGVSRSKRGDLTAKVIAKEVMASRYADDRTLPSAIHRAWEWVSNNSQGKLSSSTVAALVIDEEEGLVHMAGAGDSPIFLLRKGRVYELTTKHTVYHEFIRKGGTRQEAEARGLHRKKNSLTKSINSQGNFQKPDTRREMVFAGDMFVIASDGFEKGFRAKEEMVPFFETAKTQGNPAAYLVNESLKRQQDRSYIDDIAVAVVQL